MLFFMEVISLIIRQRGPASYCARKTKPAKEIRPANPHRWLARPAADAVRSEAHYRHMTDGMPINENGRHA